jgi:CBS domain-containing membrane protein
MAAQTVHDVTISQVMQPRPKTIGPEETVRTAVVKMRVHGIRHLIVTQPDGTVIGLLSQRDILRHLAEVGQQTVEVRQVMSAPVLSGTPETTLFDAAQLMRKQRIGCLPVLSGPRRLVGILTRSDVLDFVSA